jgi:hypothetical protein
VSTDRYQVRALRCDGATVELRVSIVNPNVDDFLDTKNFALQLLLDAPDEPASALHDAIAVDHRSDEPWMLMNAERFVESVELVAAENWPAPGLNALADDDAGTSKIAETPAATYRIRATSPTVVAHISDGQVWESVAYDMGEDGIVDSWAAPAAAAADDEGPPEKPAPGYPAPVPPPDLSALTARKGQKLRAILRRPRHRARELLEEAGVYVPSSLGFVHRQTVDALAPCLLGFVDDEAEVVRDNSLWLIGDLGVGDAADALLRIVDAAPSLRVRGLAMETLAALPELPAHAASVLARALAPPAADDNERDALRVAAATALARWPHASPELAPALVAALAGERTAMVSEGEVSRRGRIPDWPVVHWLGVALANLGWDALPQITDGLADARPGVLVGVTSALARLARRTPDAAPRALGAPVVARLEELVASDNLPVRANAAVALATCAPERTRDLVDALAEAVGADPWSVATPLRVHARGLLAALGDDALPAFWRTLDKRQNLWGRHFEAAPVPPLGPLGPAALPLVARDLASSTISPHEAAVWSALLGAPDAFDGVAKLVGVWPRCTLFARTGARGLRAIHALLHDPRAEAAEVATAVGGLGWAGVAAADAEPLLAAALGHRRHDVRLAAVRALGSRAPSPGVVGLAGRALADRRRSVRASAAAPLCRLGEQRGAAELEVLWPQDPALVASAVDAFDAPAEGLLDRLREALAHPKLASVSAAALAAIAAALPNADARRARIVEAVRQVCGARDFRARCLEALARRGLVPPLEDPLAPAPLPRF